MYLTNRALLQFSSSVIGTLIFDIVLYVSLRFYKCEKRDKTKVLLFKDEGPIFHISYDPEHESLAIWEEDPQNYSKIVNTDFFSETINFRNLKGHEYDLSELIFDKLLKLNKRIESLHDKDSSNRFMNILCKEDHYKKFKLCLKTT